MKLRKQSQTPYSNKTERLAAPPSIFTPKIVQALKATQKMMFENPKK